VREFFNGDAKSYPNVGLISVWIEIAPILMVGGDFNITLSLK
jgi:hypothetical protein